ncbi:MAG TPA: 2-dehydropantoate 2-reductase N-terminal domain-containing protein [Anaerolineae bacterium]|nr:2-dehydropantoate 2-reductase N-terminal domain-containing protein [Anaerolineae bacterium]
MLKILVLGAGAIGCFVGGRLAAAGHQVTLLGRPPLMNKIATDGLKLCHPSQPPLTVRPPVITSLAELSAAEVPEFILLTVKASGTAPAIEQLAHASLSLDQSYIVSLQNGVGNEEQLAEALGWQRVIAGTVTIPIGVPDLGVIEVSKDKGGLGLASLQENQPTARLAEALTKPG